MPNLTSVLERMKHFMPLASHLRFDAVVRRLAKTGEPEVRALEQLSRGRRTAIDIGANSGQYTYPMAQIFEHVIAFEPNPGVSRPIAAARLRNVRLETVAFSASDGSATLKMPIVKGQTLFGWATLGNNTLSDASTDLLVRTARLDTYGIENVDFIKIDVEGHEPEVLAGAANTISTWLPICLIEANHGDTSKIDNILRPLGYTAHRSWNNVELSPQNLLYVPTTVTAATKWVTTANQAEQSFEKDCKMKYAAEINRYFLSQRNQ